jgi:peptidoglycan hydrolase-like protein with peptidoglycan-binding domain
MEFVPPVLARFALPQPGIGSGMGSLWFERMEADRMFLSARRAVQKGVAILALGLGLPGASPAVTPEQFAALEPEEALRLPALEAVSVFGWNQEEFLFVLENALIDLRYLYLKPAGRPSSALTSAIKAFQQETGHKPTGTLLVGEFLELVQRGNEFWQSPVVPGPQLVSHEAGVVSAKGTWVSPGAQELNPIQTTSIRCYQAAGLCSMATARLITSQEEGAWYHSPTMDLEVEAHDWKVTQWTDAQVQAEDRSGPCVTRRLSIDLRQQQAAMTSEPTGAPQCRTPGGSTRTYVLASGYEVAATFWGERRDRAHKLRSAAFQKLVEQIQSKRTPR